MLVRDEAAAQTWGVRGSRVHSRVTVLDGQRGGDAVDGNGVC